MRRHTTYHRKKERAFTLIELVLALFIMSIILLSVSSLIDNMLNVERFHKTMAEMTKLGVGFHGSQYGVQTGHQAAFGYLELHQTAPGQLAYLFELILEPRGVHSDLLMDEWGNLYNYDGANTVTSYGPNRQNNSGGSDDIEYSFKYNTLYANNIVRITVTDARGMILRSNESAESFSWHHIYQVGMFGFGQGQHKSGWTAALGHDVSTGMDDMLYEDGCFSVSSVRAGLYKINIVPVPGPNAGFGANSQAGAWNMQDNLTGLEGKPIDGKTPGFVQKLIVVYPRGNTVTQCFEVRLSGSATLAEIA